MNIEHTFVINLKNRPDRWQTIQNSFKGTTLNLQRWDAVYGKNLTKKEIKDKTTPFCNIFCSYGVIGCWLSHYYLWQYISKNNLNNVLVLEDDARPAEPITNFNKDLLTDLSIIPPNYDLVYLGCLGSCDDISNKLSDAFISQKNQPVIINGKNIPELMIPTNPLGTHAYLISNSGANKLINYPELKKVKYHIDQVLCRYVYDKKKDFNMFAVRTPLIMQSGNIEGSDLVNNDHPLINSILSKIYFSDNYNADYLMNLQLLSIRESKITITPIAVLFGLLAFVVGLVNNTLITNIFVWSLIVIYIIEFFMKEDKSNINTTIFEIFVVILFLFIGIKFSEVIKK
jgi:glycosyl transferase family 25